MRPVLEGWPQKKRNLWFGPMALGGFLVAFLVTGFVMTAAAPEANGVLVALLVGPAVGVALAWRLFGWPHLTTSTGKPLVSERAKPFLWFPLFLVFTFVGYVVLGTFLTPILPPTVLAYVALVASMLASGVLAYWLVGFPRLVKLAKDEWAQVPVERRPFLFFPIAAALTLLFYFLIGLALTQTSLPLSVQPLLALPAGLLLACAAAYLLVGFPKPQRSLKQYVPEVPGRARPLAFFLTFLVAGLPLAYLAGLALSLSPGLPHAALLPLALVLGYAAALGVAALAWGTPKRWRQFSDYRPGLPKGARIALFVPIVVGCGVAGAIVAYALGLDLFWGILPGTAAGVLVGLRLSGAWARLADLRGDSRTILPEMPDMVKPLVLFPVWFLVGGLLFVVITYAAPRLFGVAFVASAVLGLAVAVYLVEEATIKEAWVERRERKAAEAERKRRREEALRGASASGKKA